MKKSLFNLLAVVGILVIVVGSVMAAQVRAQELTPFQTSPWQGEGKVGVLSPQAGVSTAFTYQGRLTNSSSGDPIAGPCDFQFSLWDSGLTGSQVGSTQTNTNVSLDSGYFGVALDFGSAAFAGEARYLQIAVQCPAGSGGYTPLDGRVELTAAPYAHSLRPGALIQGSVAPGSIVKVQNTATGMIAGNGLGGVSANGTGVYGESQSSTGIGVEGKAASTGKGVRGESFSGYGVYGEATGDSGVIYGVYGTTASPTGHGVFGTSPSNSFLYAGVTGANTGGGAGAGVYGYSVGGYGVHGRATSGTGIYGTGSATGTVGIAADSSGSTVGVYGQAVSPSGKGVYGEGGYYGVQGRGMDNSGTSYGVYGYTESSAIGSYGGYFRNTNNVGLYAEGQDAGSRTAGDVRLAGNWGVIAADQYSNSSMSLVSNDDAQVYLDNDDNDAVSCFSIFDPGDSSIVPIWEICHSAMASSSVPATTVNTSNAGTRKLYGLSSPQVWIEDLGSGKLENGAAIITIESVFAQIVNLDDYHVFLTPLGDCNGLYVTAKSPTSFEVRELGGGTSGVAFDYRIVARQLGHEDVRLEPAQR